MDEQLAQEYEVDLGEEFATLNRVGDYQFRHDPNSAYSDDPYGDIYQDAVYGGRVDPETNQEFFVYEVEWEEASEQMTVPDAEQLGDRLDQVFEGWIIDEDGERVFALRDSDA